MDAELGNPARGMKVALVLGKITAVLLFTIIYLELQI